jgi:hypothetical protein
MEMESWVAAVTVLIWWETTGGGVFLFHRRGRKLIERILHGDLDSRLDLRLGLSVGCHASQPMITW